MTSIKEIKFTEYDIKSNWKLYKQTFSVGTGYEGKK